MPCRDRAPLAERMLGRPATIAVLVVAAGLLATWIPHYLTWPLWIDADCRLMMARAWDDGRAPYRDIVTFNFPGEIYLYWLIGRLFGWSRAPVAIHAFDAAFLVAFGAALVLWSRRALGRALPGALAFVAFLWVYLGFGGPVVGQRDWFGPALAFAAVFALQTSGSRRARAVSALLFAAGFVIRPHVVLFVPAALSAVLEPKGGVRPATPRRDAAEWIGLVAGGVVLAFVPLIAAGLVPDFVRSLSLAAPGGAYHDHDGERFGAMLATLRDEIAHAKNVVFPCASLGLAWGLREPPPPRPRAGGMAAAGARADVGDRLGGSAAVCAAAPAPVRLSGDPASRAHGRARGDRRGTRARGAGLASRGARRRGRSGGVAGHPGNSPPPARGSRVLLDRRERRRGAESCPRYLARRRAAGIPAPLPAEHGRALLLGRLRAGPRSPP
jgi:hypothetical protein